MDELEVERLMQLAVEKEDKDAINQLTEYYIDKDNYQELVKLYELLLRNNPHDSQILMQLATIYADYYNDYDKACQFYEETLRINPNDAFAHYQLGILAENHEHYEKAKDHYLKAIEINPKFIDCYISLSWLYLDKLDDVHTSYIVVQEATKYVESSEIYAHMAYIEFRKYKEIEKAEANLLKAIDLDKENDLAYTYLGQLYIVAEKYDEAKKWFIEALNLPKINELLVYEYCKLLIVEYQDFNGAIEVLKMAIKHYPDTVIYYAYIANLNFIMGNYYEAKKYLDMAENFEITSQEALLMVGYLKVMLDSDKEGALMYFEKVIEINPTNLNALSFIGFYNLVNNQHIDTALDYFKKIVDLTKDNYVIYFIIAQIYLQYYQDSTQALEYLLKINTKLLNTTELSHLYYFIGSIYEKYVKNYYLALEYYEQAYQVKPDQYLEEIINRIYELDKTMIN